MRFLILKWVYPEAIEAAYTSAPVLADYAAHQEFARATGLFGIGAAYADSLRAEGHEAVVVVANDDRMQAAWRREHAPARHLDPTTGSVARSLRRLTRPRGRELDTRLKYVMRPVLRPDAPDPAALYGTLRAQVSHYRPDVLLCHAVDMIPPSFIASLRGLVRLVVGQIAAPLNPALDLCVYDLMVTSLPHFVDRFRDAGLDSELLRLAFDPQVLQRVRGAERDVPVSFVGSLSSAHAERLTLLTRIAGEDVGLRVWSNDRSAVPAASPLATALEEAVWGDQMLAVLARSRITLNHHIETAGAYANNMRLFEATGMGALLITDEKANLPEMFEPGREVVTYRDADTCAAALRHYLDDADGAARIARAGHERTLRDHTYSRRIQELLVMLRARGYSD